MSAQGTTRPFYTTRPTILSRNSAAEGGFRWGCPKTRNTKCIHAKSSPGKSSISATDGIWEARNSQGEAFGKERLRNVLRQNADEPAEKIVAAIADAVWDFYGDKEQEDDITPVIVKML